MANATNDTPLTVDEAIDRLMVVEEYDCGNGPEPCVHTFVEGGIGLLGAHWPLADVRAAFERWGVARSGPAATAMRHGLVVVEGDPYPRSVFFETKARP